MGRFLFDCGASSSITKLLDESLDGKQIGRNNDLYQKYAHIAGI